MNAASAGYRRLSRAYRAMEFLAFGGDLERARFMHLGRLADRRRILVLGEGDGRCVERLARLSPNARILCVDSSPDMVERARSRIAGTQAQSRVEFVCADALAFEASPGAFDAIVTFFFLDCFEDAGVERILSRAGAFLEPGALWLFADFVEPAGGLRRLRARSWLAVLYAFFRWETGLSVRRLPSSEALLEKAGWRRVASTDFQLGLLRSSVYERSAATGAPEASAGSEMTGSR
jgi:ubiquinone/menaquinone biosynthesis C-methylase UbiE